MNPIDLAVIVILIVGFVWGFSKGFIYMIFSLIAIVGGVFVAGKVAPLVLPYIFDAKYNQLGYIVLFILFFTIIYFIIKKLCYVVEDMVEFLELEWLDSLLGGVIGLAQFLIIVGVLVSLATHSGLFRMIPGKDEITLAYFVSDTSQNVINFIAGNIKNIYPMQ